MAIGGCRHLADTSSEEDWSGASQRYEDRGARSKGFTVVDKVEDVDYAPSFYRFDMTLHPTGNEA